MPQAVSRLFATDEPNFRAHPELSDRMTEARRPGRDVLKAQQAGFHRRPSCVAHFPGYRSLMSADGRGTAVTQVSRGEAAMRRPTALELSRRRILTGTAASVALGSM